MSSDAARHTVAMNLPPGEYDVRISADNGLWTLSYVDRPSAVDSSYSIGGAVETSDDNIEVSIECPIPSEAGTRAEEAKDKEVIRMNGTRNDSSEDEFILVQNWPEDGVSFSLCRRGISVRNIRRVRTDEAVVPKPQKRRRLQKKSSRKKRRA